MVPSSVFFFFAYRSFFYDIKTVNFPQIYIYAKEILFMNNQHNKEKIEERLSQSLLVGINIKYIYLVQ